MIKLAILLVLLAISGWLAWSLWRDEINDDECLVSYFDE